MVRVASMGCSPPRSVTVSPGGQSVYVAGYGDDAVAVFSRDADTGRLTFLEAIKDGQNGVDGMDGATLRSSRSRREPRLCVGVCSTMPWPCSPAMRLPAGSLSCSG